MIYEFVNVLISSFCLYITIVGDEKHVNPISAKEINAASDKALGATVPPASVPGKMVGSVVSPVMTTALELRNPSNINTKTSPTATLNQACTVLPSDSWLQVCSTNFTYGSFLLLI